MIKLPKIIITGIFSAIFPLSLQAMEFSIFEGGKKCSGCLLVKADGEITETTPDKFEKLLNNESLSSKRNVVVVMNSQGGSLWGGLKLGQQIRSKSFDTHIGKMEMTQTGEPQIIDGQCASACAYAFLGGKNRSKELKSAYGLHQISTKTTSAIPLNHAVKSVQNLLSEISKYVDKMGVSPELVILATQTESERINWIDSSAMVTYRVINSDGLSQQKPWQLVQPKTWSVFSQLENGEENLLLMRCYEIPGRLNKRGYVKVSIIPSLVLPSDSPYVNSYSPAAVSVTLGKSSIVKSDITVYFMGVKQSFQGIEIPSWALDEALRNNIELGVSISYSESFPKELLLQHYSIPTAGLSNAIEELRTSCPHLRD